MRIPRVLLPFIAVPAFAQEPPPLVTDRPDQTESAVVVPRGLVQLEVGGLVTTPSTVPAGPTRVVTVGTSLLRLGVAPRIELRVGFGGWQHVAADGAPDVRGVSDLEAGAKVALADGDGFRPAIALLGGVTLPTGHEAFRAAGLDPEIRISVAHELPAGFGLGYNLGASWTTETGTSGGETLEPDLLYTLTVGRALTSRVGAFLEGFGNLAVRTDRATWHALDGGATVALRPNLQLDLAAGVGLGAAPDAWFVGLGMSLRVPR